MESNFKIVDFIIRIFVLGLLFTWCFIIIRPFIVITLWGVVLAIAIFPVFLWLKKHIGGRSNLAATLLALLGIAIIIGPVSLIATVLLHNAQTIVESIEAGTFAIPSPPSDIATLPVIGQPVNEMWQRASVNLEGVIGQFKPQIQEFAKTLLFQVTNTGLTLLKFIVSIIIAAILMLNADRLNRGLIRFVSHLSPSRGEEFINLATTTIRSVTRGIIGVAIIQTIMVGLGLILAKIPAAGLLTLLSLFLSIIQIGPLLIVVPTLIFVWSAMSPVTAILFTLWMIPTALIDNILKPILMGQGWLTDKS